MYGKEIARVLVSKEEIDARVKVLGRQIVEDLHGESVTMVCTLRGACV